MSEIYDNAIDSLEIGIDFFLKKKNYSSRKHSILTLFHSIELFLKEYLYRTNPILIYRHIDKKITEDSLTVGIKEILCRLENLGLGIPKEQQKIIEKIHKKRNRIEHYRYDHKNEDENTIAESLKFIMFFIEEMLNKKLEENLPSKVVRQIQSIVFDYNERYGLAEHRIEKWMKETWKSWNPEESSIPEEFSGTVDCPECGQTYLVIGYHDKPFCFYCNTTIDASECEDCGITYFSKEGCPWCADEKIA